MAGHVPSQSERQGEMRKLLKPETTTFLVKILYAVCGLLFLVGIGLQLFTHAFDHAHYGFETWPGFYGIFGFVIFVFIVVCGWALRQLVHRDENYYQPDQPERSK